MIMITHDLGVIAEVAQRVIVMYAGKIVEEANVRTIFKNPQHPYTIGLIKSIPVLNQKIKRLSVIRGTVPNPTEFPSGCRFHDRCPIADEKCETDLPQKETVGENHFVSCWKSGQAKPVDFQ